MKTPRYFCEFCGAEVKGNAKICPRCGRFFSSVKCPKCGYAGRSEDFRDGCPVCGYADGDNTGTPEPLRPPPESAGALPLWTWIFAFALLGIVLYLLFLAMRG